MTKMIKKKRKKIKYAKNKSINYKSIIEIEIIFYLK